VSRFSSLTLRSRHSFHNLIDQRENDERSSMGQLCGVTKDVINGQQLKEVLRFDYLDSQNQ
ncbi:hypothetical protein ACIMRO_002972, partial [Enterococcus hirae]